MLPKPTDTRAVKTKYRAVVYRSCKMEEEKKKESVGRVRESLLGSGRGNRGLNDTVVTFVVGTALMDRLISLT